MSDPLPHAAAKCPHCHFGLIVTGAGEREFLPALFRSLMERAGCTFEVLRKIGQRSPIGTKRQLKMVGRGQVLSDKDEEEIGLPARRFLHAKPCHFVVLIDDLESDRIPQRDAIRNRYRTALETMVPAHDISRAAVHFLANMLEAYYFADASAVNGHFQATVLASDFEGDVETIRHPKNELKERVRALGKSFDEKDDGREILRRLNVDHVLEKPDTCRSLRALFLWCVEQIEAHCPIWDSTISNAYRRTDGQRIA